MAAQARAFKLESDFLARGFIGFDRAAIKKRVSNGYTLLSICDFHHVFA
jgi:hypothetical protein